MVRAVGQGPIGRATDNAIGEVVDGDGWCERAIERATDCKLYGL